MKKDLVKKYYNQSNKVFGSILMIGIMILLVGFSYAFFVYNKTGLYTHTITGGKMSIIYNEITGNNITIDNAYPLRDEEALTKGLEFEFTISGYNESDKNIYYAIEMDYGEDVENKTRFKDSDLKLSLYENEKKIFENEIFNNLDNQDIYYGYINYGTSAELPTTNNYLLRIWINDDVLITDTPDTVDTTGKSVYSSTEFANRYANFKVNVKADLFYDSVGFLTYDANGGSFTPKKTSLLTNKITLQKPVIENKSFLGWSGTRNGEVEYKAGDVYTGDYDVLYAVYGDTRNIIGDLSSFSDYYGTITEVKFINDTQENIDVRYNAASIKSDLTLDNQGSVKGWLESDEDGNSILYIGSEGTIYLTNCREMFAEWSSLVNIDFSNIDTSMVTDMSGMFVGNINLINFDGSSFNTSKVTDMSYMFYGLAVSSMDISNFDTSQVTNMSYMFYIFPSEFIAYFVGTTLRETITELDLGSFDTSNVTNMSYMFYECRSLTDLDVSNFDTSQVTDMSNMFYECNSLTDLDVSDFDTSQVTDMSGMFCGCTSLTDLDVSNFDTSQVITMSYIFSGCGSLTELDVSNFDTSQVTNMSGIFNCCSNLKSLDVSNFDTSQVTNMSGVFGGCSGLAELDISNFDTSKVTDMSTMFYECSGLTELDVDNFDTSQVTSMDYMFSGCINLPELDVSNFDTCNVTTMQQMFGLCSNFTELDVSNFDTSKVTNMRYMFFECSGLKELDVSNFDISQVTMVDRMFASCNNLKTIYSNIDWNTENVTYSSWMFDNCTSLVGAVSYYYKYVDITMANPDTGYFTRKTV